MPADARMRGNCGSIRQGLTVGLQQALQGVHFVLLALQLQGDGGEGDIADSAVEDVGQVAELAPLGRAAAHLDQHQLTRRVRPRGQILHLRPGISAHATFTLPNGVKSNNIESIPRKRVPCTSPNGVKSYDIESIPRKRVPCTSPTGVKSYDIESIQRK